MFFSFAMFFKLGAFPFHAWLCDVYDGSIINVTAFFATIPKVVILSFFLKVAISIFHDNTEAFCYLLAFAGLGSICFASVAALYQKRIKRLFAYSTISHTGFLLLGMYCLTPEAFKACFIYIALYIVMTLTLFSLLLSSGVNNSQQKYLLNWTALFERNIAFAFAFAITLYSIAGIPPLAGFYSKLCVLTCLLSQNSVVIACIIACFSSIACFYYIKLVKIMFFVQSTKTTFWFGESSKSIELFVSFGLSVIMLFLLKPNFMINVSSLASLSLS
jgi:NADH-quinone oxidoreductase subunit N